MNRRIMLTLAIAAGLLNSGFSVGATDSDTKPVSVQSLKEKVEKLRIAAEDATKRANDVELQCDVKAKMIDYSENFIIALLAACGVIAPLVRTVSPMYDFISGKDGIDMRATVDNIALGMLIQVTAAGLMIGTKGLARSIYNYFKGPYWKMSNEKYEAVCNYEKAKEELAKELAKEELAKAEKQNSNNCHLIVIHSN